MLRKCVYHKMCFHIRLSYSWVFITLRKNICFRKWNTRKKVVMVLQKEKIRQILPCNALYSPILVVIFCVKSWCCFIFIFFWTRNTKAEKKKKKSINISENAHHRNHTGTFFVVGVQNSIRTTIVLPCSFLWLAYVLPFTVEKRSCTSILYPNVRIGFMHTNKKKREGEEKGMTMNCVWNKRYERNISLARAFTFYCGGFASKKKYASS